VTWEGEEKKDNLAIDTPLHGDNIAAMRTTIQIRCDGSMRRELKKLADRDRRSLSDYLRLLLEKVIQQSKEREEEAAKAASV